MIKVCDHLIVLHSVVRVIQTAMKKMRRQNKGKKLFGGMKMMMSSGILRHIQPIKSLHM